MMSYNLVIILLFTILSLTSMEIYGQNDHERKVPVKLFYNYILDSNHVTIKDMKTVFGEEIILMEEKVYTDSCLDTMTHEDCVLQVQKLFKDTDIVNSKIFNKYLFESGKLIPDSSQNIYSIIDSAMIKSNILSLWFDKEVVYFSLGYEEDLVTPIILGIYGTDGSLILNSNSHIKFMGGIEDEDGYVNVRNEPTINGIVNQKLFLDDFIWFTPSTENDWWRVYGIDRYKFLGYVHSSRIRSFDLLTSSQRLKIIEKNSDRHNWLKALK